MPRYEVSHSAYLTPLHRTPHICVVPLLSLHSASYTLWGPIAIMTPRRVSGWSARRVDEECARRARGEQPQAESSSKGPRNCVTDTSSRPANSTKRKRDSSEEAETLMTPLTCSLDQVLRRRKIYDADAERLVK